MRHHRPPWKGLKILKSLRQIACLPQILSRAQNEGDFPFLSRIQFDLHLQGRARVKTNADLSREPRTPERGGLRERSVASQKFRAVRRAGTRQLAAGHKRHAAFKVGVER